MDYVPNKLIAEEFEKIHSGFIQEDTHESEDVEVSNRTVIYHLDI